MYFKISKMAHCILCQYKFVAMPGKSSETQRPSFYRCSEKASKIHEFRLSVINRQMKKQIANSATRPRSSTSAFLISSLYYFRCNIWLWNKDANFFIILSRFKSYFVCFIKNSFNNNAMGLFGSTNR